VVAKKLKSSKFVSHQINLGTVTDPYQPAEAHYQLTRGLPKVLLDYKHPVSILTKSDLVVRDLDMLRRMQEVDVHFTVNTLDEKWKSLVEPHSPIIKQRLQTMKKLADAGITVAAMMGPYFPFFTDSEALFRKFNAIGVSHVFTESFNTLGGNWTGVDAVLKKHYPYLLLTMRKTLFNKKDFYQFYCEVEKKLEA
jgi:DNA repair photolyase